MNRHPDLNIILPIQNAEQSIVARLRLLIDVLSDLAAQFEIIVVDDASVDQTFLAVAEFACDFRQIALKRHVAPQGIMATIRTGWAMVTGGLVYVQDPQLEISPADIKQFWSSGYRNNLCQYSPPAPNSQMEEKLIQRLSDWCNALKRIQSQKQKPQQSTGLNLPDLTRIDQAVSTTRSPKITVGNRRRSQISGY